MQSEQRQRKVLVFCLSGLGDAVMASPAIAALAAEPQRFRLTLLTMFESVAEYLREQAFTEDVRFVNFLGGAKAGVLHGLWQLRQERFDVSVLAYPHNRLEYNAVARVVGARERIGFRYQRQSHVNLPGLNQMVFDEEPKLHVVEENLRWAAYLLAEDVQGLADDMRFRSSPESVRQANEFLGEHSLADASPLVGIHPSCNPMKNQQRRCWSPSQFARFMERMSERQPSMRFVLFEGPQDEKVSSVLHKKPGFVAVARRLPIGAVAAVIRRCQLFVGNDSGLLHVASACKVPCVAIFGPTNPTWVRPWRTPHIVVNRNLPCSPCFHYSSRPLSCPARLDYACVRELPLEPVENAAWQLLHQSHASTVSA
jgi:heptosyltransferase-2